MSNPTSHATVRRVTAACVAVAAAGIVTSPSAMAAGSTPACGNADLTASYRHSDDGAGHVYGWIVLRNTSGHTCHTGGYGGVSYVGDGNGTQIGSPAVRTDSGAAATYVLRPGQRLRSPLDQVVAQNYPRSRCHPGHVDGFRVYVPNATLSQYVAHPTTGCRNAHVHLLFQKPLQRP